MTESSIRPDLAPLLAATKSEAKRWSAEGPNLLLLAAVVAQRHEAEFRATFGEHGIAEIERALSVGGTPADETAVITMLDAAGSAGGVGALVQSLHATLSVTTAAPAPETNAPPAPVSEEDQVEEPGLDGRVTHLVRFVPPDESVLGREGVVDDILTVVGRSRPGLAMVIGRPGSGRTSVAAAMAARLASPKYAGPLSQHRVLVAPAAGLVEEGRGRALRWVIEAVEDKDVVLFLDDFDVVAGMGGSSVDLDVLNVLRTVESVGKLKVVATMAAHTASRLSVHDADLAGRVTRIALTELPNALLADAARAAGARLAAAHGTSIPGETAVLATAPPREDDFWVHPGLAERRLDAACVRARLRQDPSVQDSDLTVGAESPVDWFSSAELGERLRRRVIGQNTSVDAVARRLVLTRSGLDLRPERPDGAFLLVGPTGVGKTELAKAVCAEFFRDEQRLIRLDMSEYAHDWAVSRLVGPMPGFVGSTEPESWLTTRVRQRPETVVLLDEIEKAHPTVWNTFLQVLDAGRLTDSRGEVADFSKTVIFMTSNLGASAFSSKGVGFTSGAAPIAAQESRVLDAVKAAMAPELINRLDGMIVFQPLAAETMLEIAAKEVGRVLDRLAGLGYRLTVDATVLEHLARTGYDPAYGARHLQRNIERELLQPLAECDQRVLTAFVEDGAIRWSPA